MGAVFGALVLYLLILIVEGIFKGFGKIGDALQEPARRKKIDVLEEIVDETIARNKTILYRKYKQTHYIDDYGKACSNGWDREVKYFIKNILEPEYLSNAEYDFSTLNINQEWLKEKIDLEMWSMQGQEAKSNCRKKKKGDKKEKIKVETGVDYEYYIEKILEDSNYNVNRTPTTGDQGVDLIATKNDIRIAIQCKYYSKPVGNKAVQEVVAGKDYYECEYACVVSNNSFTPAAKKLASVSDVLLLNEDNIVKELDDLLRESKTKFADTELDDEELLLTDLSDEDDLIRIK